MQDIQYLTPVGVATDRLRTTVTEGLKGSSLLSQVKCEELQGSHAGFPMWL